MNAMIDWLGQTSVASTAVLVLLLASRRLLARRLGAQAVYLLWLAIPLGLVLLAMFSGSAIATLFPALLPPLNVSALAGAAQAAASTSAAPGPATWLGLAWLAGCSVMLVRLARQLRAAGRLVDGETLKPCANAAATVEFADGPDRFRIRRSACIAAPVVVGLFRPIILVPEDFNHRLDKATRALVLRHEICHAGRRDNLVNLFAGLALLALLIAAAVLVAPATHAGNAPAADSHAATENITPIVRINPGYPRDAAENGVEGFVTAEFTITENGSVSDIVVLESEPTGVFDNQATQTLAKWRFKPWVEDGMAQPFRVTQTIEFNID